MARHSRRYLLRTASYQTNKSNRNKIQALMKEMNPGTKGMQPRPSYAEQTYSQQNASEDCLYLDIWVPDEPAAAVPVYIYYHGGANASSSGHNPYEDAANLCREAGIIVVRPTCREGFLGWAHFGLITDVFPEAVNLGLQDQIAALHWVSDNIEAFGGDRQNITIGGESAGATAVSGLLTYPPVQAIARRAIVQSLSPFHAWCTQEKKTGCAQQSKASFCGPKEGLSFTYSESRRLRGFAHLGTPHGEIRKDG